MMKNEVHVVVSVIMPVYNSEKYLEDAIESVLAQTFQNIELIIVDDGSTDNSLSLCNKYAAIDSRIKTIHKENNGVCSARNVGISYAKGEYICFIDNDDLYDKYFIEKMLHVAYHNTIDIIKCGRKNILINAGLKEFKSKEYCFKDSKCYTFDEFIENYYPIKLTGCFNSVWNGMYKADFLKENNLYFDENVRHGNEDLLFNYYALECGPRIYLLKDILYTHYYRLSHSMSMKFYDDQVDTKLNAIEVEKRLTINLNKKIKDLIEFEEIRECLRIISCCKKKESRIKAIEKVDNFFDLNEAKKKKIFSNLHGIQRLDWLFFKSGWFQGYFLYKGFQKKMHR